MVQDLLQIISHFFSADQVNSIKPHGEGHIHETYHVKTNGDNPDYILQKINNKIFRDIPGMMGNIETVTQHFRNKHAEKPGLDSANISLTLLKTKNGQSWLNDENGDPWRVYVFITGTIIYQQVTDPSLAFEAGKAIGIFQAALSDLKVPLVETIPDFHNVHFRISQYEQAKNQDSASRLKHVQEDITFAGQRLSRMKQYYDSLKGKAALRPTHNDTKLNNILFDRNGKAVCLIDLDTVMPGFVHFDYGDALRTMANTASEDEKELDKVHFDEDIYREFNRGYLHSASDFLTRDELVLLPFAPVYLTFLIGLRFLTDHLNGDVYYRIHHPGHNLERARVQFRLVEEMEKALNF
jgi:Ser/Thr protein kinase RdoA (MazF antagonist)